MGYPPTTEQDAGTLGSCANIDDTISKDTAYLNARIAQVAVTSQQLAIVDAVERVHDLTGEWPRTIPLARMLFRSMSSLGADLRSLRRLGCVGWGDGRVRLLRRPDGIVWRTAAVES